MEKGLSPWKALEASRKAISKCWFRFVGLGFVVMLIMLVGMLPLGIGLIWVMPLMLIAFRNVIFLGLKVHLLLSIKNYNES